MHWHWVLLHLGEYVQPTSWHNEPQLRPVSADDVSVRSESCVRNWVDWTWRGKAHVCLHKVQQLTAHVRAQTQPWNLRDCLRNQGISSFHQCTLAMFKPSWSGLTKVEASLRLQGQGKIQKAPSQILQCLISGECRMILHSCSYFCPVFHHQSGMSSTAAGSIQLVLPFCTADLDVSEWVRKGTLI